MGILILIKVFYNMYLLFISIDSILIYFICLVQQVHKVFSLIHDFGIVKILMSHCR